MPGEIGLDHLGGAADVALQIRLRDQHAGRRYDQVQRSFGEDAVGERLMATDLSGIVMDGPHLVGQFLARRGEPLLVAPGQDDFGARGRV